MSAVSVQDPAATPPLVVAMGMAGAGKTTFGRALAERLAVEFLEGDELHPRANVDKMRAGIALGDADRVPWLDAIAAWLSAQLSAGRGGVVSCSALRQSYRDRLRAAGPLRFVFLELSRDLARERLQARAGHFMPASLVESQWETLETPDHETDVLTLPAGRAIDELCRRTQEWLAEGRGR
jgi:gluconokinase